MGLLVSKTRSKIIDCCQICSSQNLKSVLFLGHVPPVNDLVPVTECVSEQYEFPLEMIRCNDCTLVQINCEVNSEVLFPPTYPYLSGTTQNLRDNFADLYAKVNEIAGLTAEDLIVDIGSNDGTLLSNFHKGGHRVLGVEPSNAGLVARERGIDTRIDFFSRKLAERLVREVGPARVVTACNVFAHIPDVHGIVEGIKTLIGTDGIFVSENHYLGDLLRTVQYDTVYHEHLRYYALGSLEKLFAAHGLEVFHCYRIPTHGGSIRVFTAAKGRFPVRDSVREIQREEAELGVDDGHALERFVARTQSSKLELMALLASIKRDGARVYGIGAPSRASTMITYTGLDDGIIDCIVEVSSSKKIGNFMPGTRIPVVDEQKLFDDQPEFSLVFSWHISDGLMVKLRDRGYRGKFIIPLPEPRIV